MKNSRLFTSIKNVINCVEIFPKLIRLVNHKEYKPHKIIPIALKIAIK